MVCGRCFKSGLMLMFSTYKVTFDVDIWAVFDAAAVLATFYTNRVNFYQPFGHSVIGVSLR